jgi:hypothetical protein
VKLQVKTQFHWPEFFMNTLRCCYSLIVSSMLASGCAEHTLVAQSDRYGFDHSVVSGDGFSHRVLHKAGAGAVAHVYIEGDGRPWLNRRSIAANPTPAKPLMPELMALDPAPAIFLGRPCYFDLTDSACSPEWWTDKRYSREVVRSLDAALGAIAKNYKHIVLIGHSGGGALAMLLAARSSDVIAIITLAGNLDTQNWVVYHDYTALKGSLNPAAQAPLPENIAQWHYLGSDDVNITPEMLLPMIAQQPNARLRLLADVDHTCCWAKAWPAILQQVSLGK